MDALSSKVTDDHELQMGTTKTFASIKHPDGEEGLIAVPNKLKGLKGDLDNIDGDNKSLNKIRAAREPHADTPAKRTKF